LIKVKNGLDPFTSSPNIVVSPNIAINLNQNNTQTQNKGLATDDIANMLEIFEAMKKDIASSEIDKRSKLNINHNIDKAMVELEEPASGEEPQKSKILGFLKKSGEIIKAAGGTANSLSSFINQANKLGAYLGENMNFLSFLA
jgi:hypothetical protein